MGAVYLVYNFGELFPVWGNPQLEGEWDSERGIIYIYRMGGR